MPKSIYFSDDRYEQIVEAARKCGFRVSRGRGSQLAQFVVWASNNACQHDTDHFVEDGYECCMACGERLHETIRR